MIPNYARIRMRKVRGTAKFPEMYCVDISIKNGVQIFSNALSRETASKVLEGFKKVYNPTDPKPTMDKFITTCTKMFIEFQFINIEFCDINTPWVYLSWAESDV